MDKDKLIEKIKKNQEEMVQKGAVLHNDKLLTTEEVEERFRQIDQKYEKREKISDKVKDIKYGVPVNGKLTGYLMGIKQNVKK
jgi:hypothetical protein